MRAGLRVVVLLVVAMVLGACGSSDDAAAPATAETDQDAEATSGGGEGDEGTDGDSGDGSASSDSALPASVPDDFPIAIPSGWEIDFNEEIGLTASSTRLLYSSDRYDEIVAFYDEWTAAEPDDYQRAESDTGIIFTRSVAPPYLITIVRDHEERDQTWTLLQASGSSG